MDDPLIVDGPAPHVLPAYPLPGDDREARPLYVLERTIQFRTLHGWHRVPRGYVTDFASIPHLLTGDINPLDKWAWAAVAHDWGYAIAEPGKRQVFDEIFRERMQLDGVSAFRRWELFTGVRLGGQGGYDAASRYWDTENFVDPASGAPLAPPFVRPLAFMGQTWGLRSKPDWPT